MTFFLRALMLLTGSKDLIVLRVVCIALASLNCGLMVLVGWLATGKRAAGFLAGGILAIYPVAAFYDTDLVITSQAVILASVQLFGTIWLWRRPQQWWGALLLGLAAGAAVVTRIEVAIFAPVFILWLLAVRRDHRSFLQIAMAAILALLIAMPFVLHNRRGGRDSFAITPLAEQELYENNNRDASGISGSAGPSNAANTTVDDYLSYLRKDFYLDPQRFFELQLYKSAIFLSTHEPGNNLNYQLNGIQASQALAWNPLNFPILLAAFLFGTAELFHKRKWAVGSLLLSASLAYFSVIMLEAVLARIIQPIHIMLIPAAAFGLLRVWGAYQGDKLRPLLLRSLPILLCIGLLNTAAIYGSQYLPRDPVVNTLPSGAVAQQLMYDDVLELVGWQLRDEYSPRNVLKPFHPWVVTLYWRLHQPVDINYSFSLKYLVDETELTSIDHPLGYIVYPRIFTSEWQTGRIYVEHVGLNVKGFNGPFEQTGRIVLRVYPEQNWQNLLPALDANCIDQGEIIIARPAIRRDYGLSAIESDETDIRFGDELILRGWRIPEDATAGETIEALTAWRTGEQQIFRSLTFSLHLHRGEDSVTNVDARPRAGALETFSLPPNYLFDDRIPMTMPTEPGAYEIRLCVYESTRKERLIASEGEHNCVNLGDVHIRP